MTILSDDARLNPFPWYRTMRAEHPVYRDGGGWAWNVFRYDDVLHVLSDYETFSSQFAGDRREDSRDPLSASLISTDPPRHRQLRALVTQAFTPRAVEALAPRITQIVDGLLDSALDGGRMDVIDDLAYPLPVIVIAELLGIPAADRARFKLWSDSVVGGGNMGSPTAQREMAAYFMTMVEQRRVAPGDDLISGLLRAEIEGQHLSLTELLGFCALLLVAGNETTTNLIGNAMLCFAEHPQVWERLRADPSRVPAAVEEVLRFRSPVQSMFRVAAAGAEIDGQAVPAGSHVVAWIGSANHDEAQFQDPERFDLDRAPNKHIAFGHGIHFCLGAPLARLEGKIALTALAERLAAFDIAPGARLEPFDSTIVYGVKHLPVRYNRA